MQILSQSFSRHRAFRNHLQSHQDMMYLDENNLTREKENTNTSNPRSDITKSTQRAALSLILINDITSPHEEQTSDMNIYDFWAVVFICLTRVLYYICSCTNRY